MQLEGIRLDTGIETLLSEATTHGAIQIPPGGHPIVLLNDRQAVGGYPKPGAVIRSDCRRLAQARPGQRVRFSLCSPQQADGISWLEQHYRGHATVMTVPNTLNLSRSIESLLTRQNHRGMDHIRRALQPGYLSRAAQTLMDRPGDIFIVTGFPVADTFETDGPAGALALYRLAQRLGSTPTIISDHALVSALRDTFDCHTIADDSKLDAQKLYAARPPSASDQYRATRARLPMVATTTWRSRHIVCLFSGRTLSSTCQLPYHSHR